MSDGQHSENFEQYIERERNRLREQREALLQQQRDLESQLEAIDREYDAIAAYEAAKSGKQTPSRGRVQSRTRGASAPTRRGSRREALLQIIREGGGPTRGEILDRMGLKGDKSGEMSVSNALTALTKSNQVRRGENRKYMVN